MTAFEEKYKNEFIAFTQEYNTINLYAKFNELPKEVKEATGGSDWTKYIHPKHQRRLFFPDLWTEQELRNWGHDV